MHIINIKLVIALAALFSVAVLMLGSAPSAKADDYIQQPELPEGCSQIQVPAGNRLAFRTHALGVQIYRWNGTSWDFVAPDAKLYVSPHFRGKVGIHYAGPTWESRSGSKVVARRLEGCTPDANAIPWLLLQTVTNEGHGIFSPVTFIQRTNTIGGKAPAAPGTTVGEEARIPYSTIYYFYRADD